MIKQFLKHKCNSKIKLFMLLFVCLLLWCPCRVAATAILEVKIQMQRKAPLQPIRSTGGEFDWSGNEYTSLLPNQKEWNVSQYLIDDSRKCCSVIIDNSDLESTKQYVKSLEKTGVSTVKSQVTDDKKNPIFNYLGESDSYDISISYTGGITTISITKTK